MSLSWFGLTVWLQVFPLVYGFRITEPTQGEMHLDASSVWSNYLESMQRGNLDWISQAYKDSSSITVYNHVDGSKKEFTGTVGARTYFDALFEQLLDADDFSHQPALISPASGEKYANVFVVWSAKASGYTACSETVVLDDEQRVQWHNIVISYTDPQMDPTAGFEMPPASEVPTGSGPAHSRWANYVAAFKDQNVAEILKGYSSHAEIVLFDQAEQDKREFKAVEERKRCYEELFRRMIPGTDLAFPIVHVEEAVPAMIFAIWTNQMSGYMSAAQTFILDGEGKIQAETMVFEYEEASQDEDDSDVSHDIHISQSMQEAMCSRSVPGSVLRNEFQSEEHQLSGEICKCLVGSYIGGEYDKCAKAYNVRKFNPADMSGCKCITDDQACGAHVSGATRRLDPGHANPEICKCPWGKYVAGNGKCPAKNQFVRKFNPLHYKGCRCV